MEASATRPPALQVIRLLIEGWEERSFGGKFALYKDTKFLAVLPVKIGVCYVSYGVKQEGELPVCM